jgi:hypothetical protein
VIERDVEQFGWIGARPTSFEHFLFLFPTPALLKEL